MPVRTTLQKHLNEFQMSKLDRPQFLARVTELLAEVLDCGRASVWRLSPTRDRLVCEDLYLADQHRHRHGDELLRAHAPGYFWCMEESRAIVAPEARSHPGTSCLAEDYLVPHDIHSLLDSAILRKGAVEGVICCEQTGRARQWTPADLLAVRMATMLVGSAGL
jgi:GAF domain-containing protein